MRQTLGDYNLQAPANLRLNGIEMRKVVEHLVFGVVEGAEGQRLQVE